MTRLLALLAVAGVFPLHAQSVTTRPAQVAIPDTPAGRALGAWLAAFNSGDSAKMDAYYRAYEPAKSAATEISMRNRSGGFELVSVHASGPLHLEFQAKQRAGPIHVTSAITMSADGKTVTSFPLVAAPPGMSFRPGTITPAQRDTVIGLSLAYLNEGYVFPATARQMEQAVRARQKRGEYASITNGWTLAATLTEHLREVSRDKHLRMTFRPSFNEGLPMPTPPDEAQMRRTVAQAACGFERTDLLPGNVGYLKFNFFADPHVCGSRATAAMDSLAGASALIIDLRDNGGGTPQMVAHISSYLFDRRTHLNDLWTRSTNYTQEFWTIEGLAGRHFGEWKPVYVLTSTRTFSGAEEFSYNLKSLKRALIVGEQTGGGAHPVRGQRIDENFMIGVPYARAINPITKTNWEGVGVEPDIKVPAAEALATAQKLAAEKRKP